MVTADQFLWVVDAPFRVPVPQFSVDSDGNLYAAETYGGRTQKFKPKPGADRSRLIGSPIALMSKSTP